MKAVFEYYALCNARINVAMIDAIRGAGFDAFNAPAAGYYASVGQVLSHVYAADSLLLRDLRDSVGAARGDAERRPPEGRDGAGFACLDEYVAPRLALDARFVEFAGALSPDDLRLVVRKTVRTGELIERPLWKVLLHCFNHQTHHRGQVAQLLDGMGVPNDYSTMLAIQ